MAIRRFDGCNRDTLVDHARAAGHACQVVLCLIDLKLARLAHDPAHLDSLRDIAGYAAVLREVVR